MRPKRASSGLPESPALVQPALVQPCWPPHAGTGLPRRAALDSLKRLVERHLDSPALSAEFVCARSGWSRATVYRLFEAEGGLARYIRKRHLLRAFRELMSGQQSYRRIIDLAVAHQFSSEATFNRAFRRAFGVPPGKVRDLAASSGAVARAELRVRIDAGSGSPEPL